MDTINVKAREDAWKALLIITIILTVLVNFGLLYRIVLRAGGLVAVAAGPRGIRLQTLVSLAVGDILVALFSLVVQARFFFEGLETSLTCRTVHLSALHSAYIMPVVYGVGFVILVIEFAIFRQKDQTVSQQRPGVLWSLAVSAVPWVLAIVIVLPVTIAGEDLQLCQIHSSNKRFKASVWICQILPVIIAVLATSLNACINQKSAPLNIPSTPVEAPTSYTGQTSFTELAPTPVNVPLQVSAPPPYQEVDTVLAQPHPGSLESDQLPSLPQQQQQKTQPSHFHDQQYQNSGQLQHGQQRQDMYISHGQPTSTHPVHGQPSHSQPGLAHTSQMVYHGQPRPCINNYYSPKESRALVITSFAFFVCIMPGSIFVLSHLDHEHSLKLLPLIIITDLVAWLGFIRSVVVPLFWLTTGSLNTPEV